MSTYDIRRIDKSEYLRIQPLAIRKNNGYEFAGITLVPKKNPKNTAIPEYETGLTKEQESIYELEMQLEPGRLKRSSKFWEDYRIKIGNETLKIDDSHASGALQISILKTLSDPIIMGDVDNCLVADGLEDMKIKSRAILVISNEEQEAETSLKLAEIKDKATIIFSELSEEQLRETLLYINPYFPVETSSPKIIKKEVLDWRNRHPVEFVQIFADTKRKSKVIFINKLVNKGIVIKKSGGYFDKTNEEMIGYDLTDTIEKLFSPKMKSILDQYNERLKVRQVE